MGEFIVNHLWGLGRTCRQTGRPFWANGVDSFAAEAHSKPS